MKVLPLSPERYAEYDQFLSRNKHALVYYSSSFKSVLEDCLSAESYYLIVEDNGCIIVVLPIFFVTGGYGCIANSLPFFGSHGSPIVDAEYSFEDVSKMFLDEADRVCRERQCIVHTMSVSPFSEKNEFYESCGFNVVDDRISQILTLTDPDVLIKNMHQKLRNGLRKAQK